MPKVQLQHDAVAFSPSGKAVAVGSSMLTGNAWRGELALYANAELAGDRKKASAKAATEAGCPSLAWLGDRRLISGCDTGAVNVWDWRGDGGVELLSGWLEHDDVVRSVAVNPDKSKAVSASDDKTLRVWDVLDSASTASVACLQGHAAQVLAGTWCNANGQIVASVSKDYTVCLWDVREASAPTAVGKLPAYATSVEWSDSHPNQLFLGHITGEVAAYDVRSLGDATMLSKEQTDLVGALAVSKDGLLAAGSDDGSIVVYDLGKSNEVVYYDNEKHADFVRGLSWDPTSKCLKSAGWDGKVATHLL